MKDFRRKMYFKLRDFIDDMDANVCFLYGPRKIGKTYCLKQLRETYTETLYVDFLSGKNVDKFDNYYRECVSENDAVKILLIDEITCLDRYDIWIGGLGHYVCNHPGLHFKIIITGSQMIALKHLSARHFCGLALDIHETFLQFDEYCLWKHNIPYGSALSDISENMFIDFLTGMQEFSRIETLYKYLEGCLEDTAVSIAKSVDYLHLQDYTITADDVEAVLLASLCKLSDFSNWQKIQKGTKQLINVFDAYNAEHPASLKADTEILDRLLSESEKAFGILTGYDPDKFKEVIRFLLYSEIACIVTRSEKDKDYINDWLFKNDDRIKPGAFFKNRTLVIKYPFFVMSMAKGLAGMIGLDDVLSRQFLGKMTECYIRGLYCDMNASYFSKEFRDDTKEVDIVDDRSASLIEISVSDKPPGRLNFKYVPNSEHYNWVSVGRTSSGSRISYFAYSYVLCTNLSDMNKCTSYLRENGCIRA